MILETAATTAIVSAAKPLVKPFVEKYVTSKLQSFAEWCKKKHKEVMIPTAEHFQEYLERSYDKYSIVNTLVFHNSQRQLKDIYVAQTLIKENRFDDKKETITIDKLPIALIKKYRKILITDTAGMGKSTIMKRMFIDLIDNGLSDVGIPIYVELNKLNKDHTILTEIQDELCSLSEKFDNELLLNLIQIGGFIFFLDGFDEISIKDRNEVTIDIHDFVSKAGNYNYYILTSRPENSLASFGDFQAFNIQPLSKEEAFLLLEKYDESTEKNLSKKLVELLKSGEYDSVDEFLVNPLLVSLLYTAYDYNRSIPFEKHRFYGTVFEAYFEKHDVTKPMKPRDKYSGLNLDGFDSVMRYIGYKCLTSIGVKFGKDSILNIIRDARDYRGNLSFSEYDLLNDLETSVPLFCREGTEYKWVHKSLMEYFAARFIFCDAKQKQDDILGRIFKSEHVDKYLNLLDLYYDIDNHGFIKNIELPLLQEYIEFYKANMFTSSSIDNKLIEERIGYLYAQTIFIDSSWDKYSEKKIKKHTYDIKYVWDKACNYISEKYNISINNGYSSSEQIFVGIYSHPHRKVMDLVAKKHYSLFNKSERYWIGSIENLYDMQVLDCHTGEENEEIYSYLNRLVIVHSHGKNRNELNYYLSYQKCCNEIERIMKMIKKNDETLSMFDGL